MIPLTSYHLPITGYVNLPKLQAYQVTAASPGVVVKDLRNMGAMSHSCGLRQLNYCYIFGTSSSLLSLVTPLPHSTWFEFTVMPNRYVHGDLAMTDTTGSASPSAKQAALLPVAPPVKEQLSDRRFCLRWRRRYARRLGTRGGR